MNTLKANCILSRLTQLAHLKAKNKKKSKPKQNVFVIEMHLQVSEGQQLLPGFNLQYNTNINP